MNKLIDGLADSIAEIICIGILAMQILYNYLFVL